VDRVPFEFVEGATSDLTFRAHGRGLDELFTAAADATTAAMVDSLDSVSVITSRSVSLDGRALDLLLMSFLDEIIFWKDADQLLLRATDVHVRGQNGRYEVRAELRGERIDPDKHRLEADVKAVTLHGLRVERADDGWLAEVTLDV
jgi:SHS2 domain-containing protein